MNSKKKSVIDYNHKVLEVRNLKQYFKVGVGNRRMTVKAIDGISFDIYKREVFGLVGESGCGKTTTGRTIIKIYNATDGTIKYNGRIIGAGLQGDKQRIRELKQNRKLEIIQQNPLKKKIYELKQKAKSDIHVLNDDINKIRVQTEVEVNKLKAKPAEFSNVLELALHRYETEKNQVLRERKIKLDRISENDIKDAINMYNKTINVIKRKTVDKSKYIKSLQVNKEEIEEAIEEIKTTEVENLNVAKEKLLKTIESLDPKLVSVYERQVTSNNPVKYVAHVDLKSEIVKNKIKEIEDYYEKVLVKLKSDYDVELNEISKNKPDKQELKNSINELKANAKQKIKAIQDKINKIKQETKAQILQVKQDAKKEPNKFLVNQSEIDKVKNKYKKLIQEAKEVLREHRYLNKIKETPKEKRARLQKMEELKEAYQKKIVGLSPEAAAREKEAYENEIRKLNESIPNYANTMSTMQMVFQDPIASLNPRMIVKDIISEGLIVRGERDSKLINEKVNKILDIVGLTPDHATRYPHEFSGGQRQRIGIARALITNPDFVIADEPISALDVSIQAQILNLLSDLKNELGLTILFIAHDLSVVKYFCDRIAVMYFGKIVEMASSEELFKNPLHPYTKSLLSAIPQPDPIYEANRSRVVYNPSIHNYTIDKPELVEITPGHFIYANNEELAKYKEELGIK